MKRARVWLLVVCILSAATIAISIEAVFYASRSASSSLHGVDIGDRPPGQDSQYADNSIQYTNSAAFMRQLLTISTGNWHTYVSPSGFHIQYPTEWEAFSCMDGIQVFFYETDVPETCDSPNTGATFTIIGPVSAGEVSFPTSSARFQDSFMFDGTKATRFDEIIVNGKVIDLIVLNYAGKDLYLVEGSSQQRLLEERMLVSFQW